MSKEKLNFLAAIEIGTSKVAMSVASLEGEQINVLAFAQQPHKGIHQGLVVDTKTISQAVQKVKAEIEVTLGQPISHIYLSVADLSEETLFSKGVVSLRRHVGQKDIDKAMESAIESAQLRSDRCILHSLPYYYKVDGLKFQQAPINQKGTALELAAMLITANKKNIEMAKECVESQGLFVHEVVSSAYASALSLTTEDQRARGVAVIDIGYSLTQMIVFKQSGPVLVVQLPLGGLNFTQDLAVGLRTPQLAAENIKKAYGAAMIDMISAESFVEVQSLKGEQPRQVPQRFIGEILEARAEETLGLILKKLNDEDLLFQLEAGIFLTGGGSLLPGLSELGKYTFDVPLQRGIPKELAGIGPLNQSPGLSTVLGLLHYGRKRHSFESRELSIDTFKSKWGQIKNLIDNIL